MQTLPANLATNDVIDEPWVDAVRACLAELQPAALPTAWTPVTFTGGWVNFGGAYQTAQYRKVGDVVQMRGVIKSGTMGAAAATLPVGFRPPATNQFVGVSAGTFGYTVVDASGAVVPSIGTNASFDLSPVTFSVTP